jgi:hypothetical protein
LQSDDCRVAMDTAPGNRHARGNPDLANANRERRTGALSSSIRHSSRFTRQSAVLTLFALVAAGVFCFWAAPPAPEALDPRAWAELSARTIGGAYHVHTTRSDGLGDRAAVAAAAARAGLSFVILTDHGDGTRPPDPPAYVSGVLLLDGVEISTDDGHYAAFDMRRAPYPLGGTAEAVVEDVARLGGVGVAAYPDSPKPSLRWTADGTPIGGIEWLNTDSEWRGKSRIRLARAAFGYLFRPGPALAALFDRPATLDRHDRHPRVCGELSRLQQSPRPGSAAVR